MQLTFTIQSAGAWSPLYQQLTDWQHWPHSQVNDTDSLAIAPKLPQVPAMQRRRYSKLTKMLLEVAFQCEPPAQCRTIFASRHGELNRTVTLLQDIVREQPISPIGFSQSVHNTASGIFSILTNNLAASTSIAAGENTLEQALIEAFCQLSENNQPLLLVFGDEPVSDIYKEFTSEPELPIALGLLLTKTTEHDSGLTRLTLDTGSKAMSALAKTKFTYGALLQAIASKQDLCGTLNQYHWQLNHG